MSTGNSAYIQSEIDRAAGCSCPASCTIKGNYSIDRTIILPSDFTLYLEDCTLTMADGTFVRMFENSGVSSHTANRNISVIGLGHTVLDGGNYNGLCEHNSLKDGMPHISNNNILLFSGVDGFRIENLRIINQRWWALNFLYCSGGIIRDIEFMSDCTRTDENGNRVRGLLRSHYSDTYIKNSDGIDLRCGCHDIIIDNITGFTEDDSVALTGLDGILEKMYRIEGVSSDIRNITVRNIRTSAYCSNIRLLCQGGIRMYNILVDGMTDTSADSDCLDRGGCGVRIGDNHLYGSRQPEGDEFFNITVRNVISRAAAAVSLAGRTGRIMLDNITGFDGCENEIDDTRIQ